MFRNSYQRDFFTIFYSLGSKPNCNWHIETRNGYAKRVYDEDIKSMVMELMGSNVSTTYMCSPEHPRDVLGIKLPFLVLLIKNMCKYFTFEVKILDDQRFTRRFNIANFNSRTTVTSFSTSMPMSLSPGWNQINFNLADFCRRAYGTSYMETLRVCVHANIRVRRVYFSERLVTEDQLPNDYQLMPKPKEKPAARAFKVPAARPSSPAKSAGTETTLPNEPETPTTTAGDTVGETAVESIPDTAGHLDAGAPAEAAAAPTDEADAAPTVAANEEG